MKLSEHLDLAEVVKSDSAKRRGISNMPTPEHIENFKKLAEKVFEPIRKHFGVPIHISSGYRSKELNAVIGGASNSDHCFGMALDLDQQGHKGGVTNKQVFDFIKDNLKFKQLIWEGGTKQEPDWVHVSYDEKNLKKEVLLATLVKGKMQYSKY
jgi:phosphoribosylaminoimidazole-succinocarboxamide synthase